MKASEYGIERHAAVNAEYEAILIGTVAEENARFFYNGMYFVLSGNVLQRKSPERVITAFILGQTPFQWTARPP